MSDPVSVTAAPEEITEGGLVILTAVKPEEDSVWEYTWKLPAGDLQEQGDDQKLPIVHWDTTGLRAGAYIITVEATASPDGQAPRYGSPRDGKVMVIVTPKPISRDDSLPVVLRRTSLPPKPDHALWVAIRNRTKAIAFSGSGYKSFIDAVLCNRTDKPDDKKFIHELEELGSTVRGVGAYELLKTASEVFLLLNCGVKINDDNFVHYDETEEVGRLDQVFPLGAIRERLESYLGTSGGRLPYIKRVLEAAFPHKTEKDNVYCDDVVISSRLDAPCLLELIWSYWHEEGMQVQTINAVSRRFQNLRSGSGPDPLAHLELDPIRPLNNVLWGYIQDELHRLTVQRRAYEYDHHYGLTLYGKAVPPLQSADSRSKFLEAYHHLLHVCTIFYELDDDTTRIADAFPVLNGLKETHLLLAQGAHNQFGDLPWTARAEMLMQQWMLARPEMRDFLQSRPMVPYLEGWMAQVDTMKKLQGWTDVTVTHFHDLGVYGEQILLAVRYGDWIGISDPAQAANWARYWRPEIQSYLHAYRAVTGVDLTAKQVDKQVDATMPSVLLRKRLDSQARVR